MQLKRQLDAVSLLKQSKVPRLSKWIILVRPSPSDSNRPNVSNIAFSKILHFKIYKDITIKVIRRKKQHLIILNSRLEFLETKIWCSPIFSISRMLRKTILGIRSNLLRRKAKGIQFWKMMFWKSRTLTPHSLQIVNLEGISVGEPIQYSLIPILEM